MKRERTENNFQFSLTAEILISLILLMVISISMIGIISLGVLEATRKSTLPSRADFITDMIMRTITRLSQRDDFSLTGIIPEVGYYTNIKEVAIVNADLKNVSTFTGMMETSELPYAQESLKERRIVKKESPDELNYYIPVLKNEKPEGVVRIRIPTGMEERRAIIYKKLLVMYIILGSTFIVLLGIFILRRRIVKPIHQLIQHTQKISLGNFKEYLTPSGGKELVELAEAFNIMAKTLESKQAQLEDKIKELEVKNIELLKARDEVLQAEKLALIGRMASGIAHELGNPISAISGNLELLERRTSDEKEQEILGRIRREVERMDGIIRELLDFARPKKASPQKLNVKKSIEEAIEIIKPQKGFDRINIELKASDDEIEILADPTQIKQVWINLLINSRDAMPKGGTIKIDITRSDNNIVIIFADNGVGIKKEDLDRIFEPFFTTKGPGLGTGLGLSVVQRIIQSINGKISVKSEYSKGTQFIISIPCI